MLKYKLKVIGIGILGVFLLVFGFGEFNETRKLASTGKKATGDVTEFEERSGRRNRVKYYITATFKTEAGETIVATEQVSSSVYGEGVRSKQVPVIYLPDNPATCRFAPEVSKDFAGLGVGALLVGCAIVGFVRQSA